ncbi:MAG TPA: hypothetical protein VHL31_25705 [Geminicoccus sp.]|uniref:hypothetical protein n=1 Tax=Geminicoccus sp. TaxID=2024832 RepID=UPI002E33F23F|nr:hypothetical protein [Geminicoccus sp.]HEX2529673.1 hypothetical protein [Geminicoccus sp.]
MDFALGSDVAPGRLKLANDPAQMVQLDLAGQSGWRLPHAHFDRLNLELPPVSTSAISDASPARATPLPSVFAARSPSAAIKLHLDMVFILPEPASSATSRWMTLVKPFTRKL